MPKGREITLYERERIETYLRMRKKKIWIARKLNRDYSIIKREIKRNSGEYIPYHAQEAQKYSERRKKKTNIRKLEKWQNQSLKEYVEEKLKFGWSPEQIAGTLKAHPPESIVKCKDYSVSYESIYDWIYNGEGKYFGLYKLLRKKQKERNTKKVRKKGKKKTLIPHRIGIEHREEDGDFGHWETDSVIFSGKSILSVQFEKMSKLCRLHKCKNKSARASEEAIWDSIESIGVYFWRTLTRDNGSENVLHEKSDVPSFFCDPYASWQKGGVENLNSLIREYLPKRSNLDTITEEEIFTLQERLNNRPRKSLNYKTPNEIFNEVRSQNFKKGALNS